jgi:hypothetical protein
MAKQYCGSCKTWHKPEEGYYWGPTYDCYQETPPAEQALELAQANDERLSKIENLLWAISKKLNIDI